MQFQLSMIVKKHKKISLRESQSRPTQLIRFLAKSKQNRHLKNISQANKIGLLRVTARFEGRLKNGLKVNTIQLYESKKRKRSEKLKANHLNKAFAIKR